MSDHTCKYGTEVKSSPVKSYSDLLDQEGEYRDDDGKRVELPHCAACEEHQGYAPSHECPRAAPLCVDCGVGHLQWAEGGYVSWHRICDTCGSHWDLHPGESGFYRRARFYS